MGGVRARVGVWRVVRGERAWRRWEGGGQGWVCGVLIPPPPVGGRDIPACAAIALAAYAPICLPCVHSLICTTQRTMYNTRY